MSIPWLIVAVGWSSPPHENWLHEGTSRIVVSTNICHTMINYILVEVTRSHPTWIQCRHELQPQYIFTRISWRISGRSLPLKTMKQAGTCKTVHSINRWVDFCRKHICGNFVKLKLGKPNKHRICTSWCYIIRKHMLLPFDQWWFPVPCELSVWHWRVKYPREWE